MSSDVSSSFELISIEDYVAQGLYELISKITFGTMRRVKQRFSEFPPRTSEEKDAFDLAQAIESNDDFEVFKGDVMEYITIYGRDYRRPLTCHINKVRAIREGREEDANMFREQIRELERKQLASWEGTK